MPTRISVHEQPPLPPSRPPHHHYHNYYPSHYSPSSFSEGSLPPPYFRRQSSSFSSSTATQRKTPVPKHPIKISSSVKQSSRKHRQFSSGPKWIHRQGIINSINYHWVETTNTYDDQGIEAKPQDQPLVILLHGFPQFWYCWRHQLVPLSEAGYRVVAPDLRGFNLTDKPATGKRKTSLGSKDLGDDPEEAYDMETLTSDILELMQYLGHTKAHIVGHDWGGIIAWAFSARFPQHTEKLVVMNAPHLCQWRDVATDYSSASCCQQVWWTCWYSLCCQLLPSWVPETFLSYNRSWLLSSTMAASETTSTMLAFTSSASLTDVCTVPDPRKPEGFPAPIGGGGCMSNWKQSDMDLYRDAISQPGAIYALLEYYRNLWLSIQQMEHYGKISGDIPILVLWGLNDKTFPKEQYAQGWESWIEQKDNGNDVTVSYLECGHFTPEEKPDDVNRQLLEFFQRATPEQERRGDI